MRKLTGTALVLVFIFAGAVAPAGATKAPAGKLKISALSTKPELVTGGDVLAAVDVSGDSDPAKIKVRRNGIDVSADFAVKPENPNRLVGLVDGLRNGDNLITSYGPGVKKPARLSVFNAPITGPIFSGPHQTPFVCRTEDAGLGPATDGDCSAPTTVAYYYRANDNTFKALADPAGPYPANGVQTTTRDGQTVDYVIRVESGVINRSIYRFAILAPGGAIGTGWNRRFVFNFGGGCGAGYQQGSRGISSVLDGQKQELSEGYATMSGSLNVLGTACNDVLSAESAQMLKEHVIEELGEQPAWTMGEGGSGGSVQQQMIAQNYPGVLDGIMPGASFADSSSPDYPDCRLLNAYYATPAGAALTNSQRESISGLTSPIGCVPLGFGADVVVADEGCDESVVPPAQIFDPLTNPGGIRCTLWDSMVNIFGRDPATGYARRTLDNVGVQYGLQGLQDGDLTINEFLDLNEDIGGYDNNGELRVERTVADNQALATAYESGRVNFTAGGYADVPVLDIRNYQDDEPGGNVHQYVNAYKTRARLQATNGNYDNQVMWRAVGGPSVSAMSSSAVDTLGAWMDAIHADTSSASAAEKVVANKPPDAVDACWIGGVRSNGPAVIGDSNICETTYPPHSLPANRAGKPLDSFALKCQLKPIDYTEYGTSFSVSQKARLEAAFPGGVCDWSKPGVEQTELAGTWQEFGPKRQIGNRSRRLTVGALHARGAGKHKRVSFKASLRPCPETAYQAIVFEHKVKRGWRKFDVGVAKGRRCQAKGSLELGSARSRGEVKLRVRVDGIEGYAAARSKSKRYTPMR